MSNTVHITVITIYEHCTHKQLTGYDTNFTQTGVTPLYIASQKGHSDVVNILIRNGADVNMARHVRYS